MSNSVFFNNNSILTDVSNDIKREIFSYLGDFKIVYVCKEFKDLVKSLSVPKKYTTACYGMEKEDVPDKSLIQALKSLYLKAIDIDLSIKEIIQDKDISFTNKFNKIWTIINEENMKSDLEFYRALAKKKNISVDENGKSNKDRIEFLEDALEKSDINYSDITDLDLSNKKLKTIPKKLVKLNNLECINLNGNELKIFPNLLANKKSLKKLFLDNNYIKIIPDEIGDYEKLQTIHLCGNKIETLSKKIIRIVNRGLISWIPSLIYPPLTWIFPIFARELVIFVDSYVKIPKEINDSRNIAVFGS